MKHIYISLDIGSENIKIVVCELYRNKLNLLAASSFKSKGITRGLITDVELASMSIKQAFQEINDMLGIKIKKVIASVPNYLADYSIIKGSIDVTNDTITSDDVMKSLEVAIKSKKNNGKELVTVLPIDFKIDERVTVKDPVGMNGKVLSNRSIAVSVPKKNAYSVLSLLEKIGIEVVDISLNNIGDLYSFKNNDFDKKLCAIINIGAETTTSSIYNKGVVVRSSIINQGGKNIDSDISYMYKIDMETARKIKHSFGVASHNQASSSNTIEVTNKNDENIKINQMELSKIVESRVEEILDLAKNDLNTLTRKQIDYIIITGGSSNMAGFEYVASSVFGNEINIGNIKMIGVRNNKYSSCVGNIVYFISKLKLKEKNYTMVDEDELGDYSLTSNRASDSVLGKIFGYFFNE